MILFILTPPLLSSCRGRQGGSIKGCVHVDLVGRANRWHRLTDVSVHACRWMCFVICLSACVSERDERQLQLHSSAAVLCLGV